MCWTRKPHNGDIEHAHPVRCDCNAPLQDLGGQHWRASWGMMSCRKHASVIGDNAALHQLATPIVDHGVALDAQTRTCVTNINKSSGIVASCADTADNVAAQHVMPGNVNRKYNVARNFAVSERWLVDT